MLGFLEFKYIELNESADSFHSYIQDRKSGKVVSQPSSHHAHDHEELAIKHGLPSGGKDFDRNPRGNYTIKHSSKSVLLHPGGTEYVYKDVVSHIQHKHPETKNYGFRHAMIPMDEAMKLYKAPRVDHHIYIRDPKTNAIHTHPDPDIKKPYLHVDLAKKVGLPDRGVEHSKLERGHYYLHHDKKQTIVRRSGLGMHEKGQFVHNDVVSHIKHQHPETKEYSVRDDSD